MQQIQYFPLSQLQIAPENVRKTRSATIASIAASIKAQGLQQNLVGYRKGDTVFISAGGRRLTALEGLANAGELPVSIADEGVPVLIRDVTGAHEASLTENFAREAMHPADEFQAFRELAEREKLTNAEIAVRQGCTEKHVEQRMRLARVAPAIVKQYRDGKANLDQMMALAIVDDQKLQEKVWAAANASKHNDRPREPDQLRNALLSREVETDSGLGKFVGVDAYEAAGGVVRRDLLDAVASLPDAKLVEKLAMAKLQPEVEKLKAKGWGWVEARLKFDYTARQKYNQKYGAKPSASLGAIVSINEYHGNVEIQTGLVKPGTKDQAKKSARGGGIGVPLKFKCRDTFSQLHGIRTGIIRKALRDDAEFAIRVLAASMAASYMLLLPRSKSGTLEEPVSHLLDAGAGGTGFGPATVAGIRLTDPEHGKDAATWEQRISVGRERYGSILSWLMGVPAHTTYDLLAFMAIESIEAGDGVKDLQVQRFCHDTDIDLGAAWTVTPAWLAKQPREYLLSIVVDAAGKGTDKPLAKLKGQALVDRVYQVLVEKQWQPPQLRGLPTPKPAKAKKTSGKKAGAKPAKKGLKPAKVVKKAAPAKKVVKKAKPAKRRAMPVPAPLM